MMLSLVVFLSAASRLFRHGRRDLSGALRGVRLPVPFADVDEPVADLGLGHASSLRKLRLLVFVWIPVVHMSGMQRTVSQEISSDSSAS
eukprot:2293465-Rhodomonas_salina.3